MLNDNLKNEYVLFDIKAIQAGIESKNPIIGIKVINWIGIAAFLVIFFIIITSFINTSSFLSH